MDINMNNITVDSNKAYKILTYGLLCGIYSLNGSVAAYEAPPTAGGYQSAPAYGSLPPDNSSANDFPAAPNWLKRTDFSLRLQHDSQPTWSIETIQPLYESHATKTHTFFWQGRWAHQGNDNTYNIGGGYRYLTDSQNYMYGLNGFYDATGKQKHHRSGLGAEIFTTVAAWRANYYHAESKDKITEVVGGVTTTQQALSGWDADVDVPVPYVAWSRFGITYFHWNTARLARLSGYKLWLKMNWTDNIQTEIGRFNDNLASPRNFIKFNFVIGRNQSNEFTWHDHRNMKQPVALRDLSMQTLHKVQRHNDMVLEQSTSGGGGITIARGT